MHYGNIHHFMLWFYVGLSYGPTLSSEISPPAASPRGSVSWLPLAQTLQSQDSHDCNFDHWVLGSKSELETNGLEKLGTLRFEPGFTRKSVQFTIIYTFSQSTRSSRTQSSPDLLWLVQTSSCRPPANCYSKHCGSCLVQPQWRSLPSRPSPDWGLVCA